MAKTTIQIKTFAGKHEFAQNIHYILFIGMYLRLVFVGR